MPPRLNLLGASRSLAIRTRPSIASRQPRVLPAAIYRGFADQKPAAGVNENGSGLGHVSEEAAQVGDVTGETKPDIGQGTPVQEILERDEEGKEHAPEVIKEEIEESKLPESLTVDNLVALAEMELIVTRTHTFGVPSLPIPARSNLHYRYDAVVDQVTNLMMEHGKLSKAQRDMSFVLNHLRTSPPPRTNPSRPLLPGAPPPAFLPLDPIAYLTLAIDSVAPIIRIRSQKGAAGGGAALQLPVPLHVRQRRRTAIKWIIDAAAKKSSRGSGRGQFAQRVAEEVISVVEGKSSCWEKRQLIHRTGTSARANLNIMAKRRRKN